MWLKMCPKCGGDLYLREEIEGNDVVCIQCGQAWPEQVIKQHLLVSSPQARDKRRIAA